MPCCRAPRRAGPPASSPQREALLSALNGVLGDQLLDSANPLAISMSLRQDGQSLPLDKAALAQRLPAATGKILVLVHGLCMNDLQWRAAAGRPDLGEGLAQALGYTPVYLHYNTGLHTSVNGGQFAALLEQLLQAWPQEVEGLSLLTHSMGGLVARSCLPQRGAQGMDWPGRLRHLVFLGTPHHGAPLEKVGNWVDTVLGSNPVTRPFAKIGQVRSAGITDLRHGNVLPADWQGADRFAGGPDTRQPLPLPAGVACFAVAADAGRVPAAATAGASSMLPSATAWCPCPVRWASMPIRRAAWLSRPTGNGWRPETGHIALIHSLPVYQQLRRWLG